MTSPNGLLLSDDLMFASRVTATAQAHGLLVEQVRDPIEFMARAKTAPPACALVDLQVIGIGLEHFVVVLNSLSPRPRIVAYGSHVAHEMLKAARESGCDVVLPRSAFADCLELELPKWLIPP